MTDSNPSWMAKVEEVAQEVTSREGCILYHIEFVGIGKGRTLRLYIDKETPAAAAASEEGQGVSIDDCANVSRALNDILDAQEDLIPGEAYNLEVSSPGADRILSKPWHFEKAVGKKIWVKVDKALESFGVTQKGMKNAKQIEEVLKAFDGETLKFQVKDEEINIPFSAVEKSKVLFVLTKGQKK
ncbi:MAG: ribosome maturation factor RimP [Bdellovibrionales bacterium]|nr:ribosome maturation factor RimP [Bdellovibrionales bacterium]